MDSRNINVIVRNESMQIGLINNECLIQVNTPKQIYFTHAMNDPLHQLFRNLQQEKENLILLHKTDKEKIQKIIDDDIVKIQVIFNSKKQDTLIKFVKNNNLIKSYKGINSSFTYKLYINMRSKGDQATINKFETMCYK